MPIENWKQQGRKLISVHMSSGALYCVRTIYVITGHVDCGCGMPLGLWHCCVMKGCWIRAVRSGIVFKNVCVDGKHRNGMVDGAKYTIQDLASGNTSCSLEL